MPTLGLSMIVRDGEATLARCLESVRPLADEIVIADTGSSDRTREVAVEHGVRIFSIAWENDFARARNQALEEVHTDWVLSLDADEMLDPESLRVVPELLSRATIAGYNVPIRNYVLTLNERVWDREPQPNTSRLPAASGYPAYIEHENVRLFRRQAEIYFEGRVHETVGARVLGSGLKLGAANFAIHHFGFVADTETRSRKNHLYRELGREKIRERPQDAQAHFELGVEELSNFKNASAALPCFERATKLNPRLHVAWVFSGVALLQLGQYREALVKLRTAENAGSKSTLVFECQGDAYYNLGDFESARRCYRRAEQRGGETAALDSKLGLAEVRCGRVTEGVRHLRQVVEREPHSSDPYDTLVSAYVWLGRLEEAAETAEAKLEAVEPQPQFFLRAASICARLQDLDRTARLLQKGLDLFPQAPKLLEARRELEARAGARKVS
jgi:tetratricopeptide (TPR) repeat protein